MKHRDRILRTAAVVLLLYAIVSLTREYLLLCRTEKLCDELAAENTALTERHRELTEQLEQPPDERELRRLAWERLGMAAPGETIYIFTQETADREDTVWDWKLEALWKDG